MWVAVTGPVGFMCISKMDGAGCAEGRGAGRRTGGRGRAHTAPPPARRNGRDSSPVRRQKCHNNGLWIVFAAPLQILEPCTWRHVGHLPFIEKFVSFVGKKYMSRGMESGLCHFKHLISIARLVFRRKISAELFSLSIQQMRSFYQMWTLGHLHGGFNWVPIRNLLLTVRQLDNTLLVTVGKFFKKILFRLKPRYRVNFPELKQIQFIH